MITILVKDIKAVSDEVQLQFGNLSVNQLNWKPTTELWSIGQCLDHIITLNRTYFPTFDRIIRNDYRHSVWQRVPILPSIFGAMILRGVQPESEKKYKTFPVFEPTTGRVAENIVEAFLAHQEELLNFLTRLGQPQYLRMVISSPASRWITYRLSDCLEILTIHEKRHLKQAIRVMKSEQFPY